MKLALTVVLTICLICSTVVLFWEREAGPPKDGWGKPSDGLQAMVYATRPVAKVGQRCDIRLKLRNCGEERLVLPSSAYVTNPSWLNGRLYGEEIGDMELSEEPSIVLRARTGEGFVVPHRAFRTDWRSRISSSAQSLRRRPEQQDNDVRHPRKRVLDCDDRVRVGGSLPSAQAQEPGGHERRI